MFDRLMPESARLEPGGEYRTRIAVGAALICVPIGIVYGLRAWLSFDPPGRLPITLLAAGLSATCLAALLGIRKGLPLPVPATAVFGYALVHCAVVAYFLGGASGPILYWLMILPAIAVAVVSARAGFVFFTTCQLVYVGFGRLALEGHLFPHALGVEKAPQLWATSLGGLVLTFFALMVVLERSKDTVLEMLRSAHGALSEARDAAHRASDSKSEFIARVSHEIRTPMTAILGFADLVAGRLSGTDTAAGHVERIQRNARHLLGLIEDLLDLSSIEAGRLDIEPQPCDPLAIAEDVVALVQGRARSGERAPCIVRAGDVPRAIVADPKRLRQILVNLAGNAIKFSEGSRVELRVETAELAGGARVIRFAVEDEGIGIDPDKLERIFEPFEQADASTARRFGGTGLGLWISRRLCTLMGGTLRAESTPGAGSTFYVELPLRDPGGPGMARPSEGPVAAMRFEHALRVLVADGVEDNRLLVLHLLTDAGAHVTLARDGREALACARAAPEPFDVIMLDLEMPDPGGLDVARTLREEGFPGTVVALSASANADTPHMCDAAGIDTLVRKPFETASLICAVANGARGEGATRESPVPHPTESASDASETRGPGLIERCVRRFVPDGLASDPAELHRAWIAVGVTWAIAPLALLWAALLPHLFEPPVGTVFAWGFGLSAPMLLSVPFLLRKTGSVSLACNALALYGFSMIAALSYCTGGTSAPPSYWMLLIPVATPLLGIRSALGWSLLCIAFLAGLLALERSGHAAPNFVVPGASSLLPLLSTALLNPLVFALVSMYSRRQQAFISDLARANGELESARRAAEEASRAKGDFLANMSHELRTPLNAILGFAELLIEEWDRRPERHSLRESIRIVHRNGQHLLSLVNDLLDLSRVESGRIELEQIAFEPAALCEEAHELFDERARTKGLDLRLDISPTVPARVAGDPTRIGQVVLNLLGHAVESAESGAVTLRLDADSDRLRFDFEHTGVALGTGERDALFEPFGQARNGPRDGDASTGLGLAISKRLCDLMGGTLTATSRPGRGVCFRFDAPVVPACAEEPTPERPASTAASHDTARLDLHVLLAEDAPDNQVLISHILERAGASVSIAANGLEALEAIEASAQSDRPFSVVLMDMQMPHLDGYGAVRELRRRGHTLPVIALTAHAFQEERTRCLEAGCNDFATKPIERRILIDLIAHWAAPSKRAS